MKAANRGWKEICAAIGKISQSQVKQHYKDHLEGRSPETANTDKAEAEKTQLRAEEKNLGGTSNDTNQKYSKKISESAGIKTKEQNVEVLLHHPSHLQPNDTQEPIALAPNDKLIEVIRSYGAQYDERKWLAIASRHYDKTGQRISAKTAREVYEGRVPK